MKNIFKSLGVVALLIVVYSIFQGVCTGLAMLGFMAYAVVRGDITPDMMKSLGDITSITETGILGDYVVSAMALGLFLSAAGMLLFIHFTKLFRFRMSIFRSMEFKPLLYSALLVFASMFALNIFVQWFPLEDILVDEFDGLTHTLLGAFTISILAPVLEEVMFRGAIQGYMMRRFNNPWVAILAAALVFGVFHLNPVQVVYATLLGIVFGWIYYRTRSLLSVIVGHVLNNTLATVFMLFFPEEESLEVLAGESSSAMGGASEIVAFVVFAALSIFFAVKLHRMLPSVPRPWSDVCDKK